MRQVFICQHRTCTKDGATKIWEIFKHQEISNVAIKTCGCMGLCGSGPMVVIRPDNVYYWHVTPQKAHAIIEMHLLGDTPIQSMMHPRLHQQ